jgi:hypothetical protein
MTVSPSGSTLAMLVQGVEVEVVVWGSAETGGNIGFVVLQSALTRLAI